MSNESLDQAAQTESLAQSATFIQQRHRQGNLDQNSDPNDVFLSESEWEKLSKIEEAFKSNLFFEVESKNTVDNQVALLVHLEKEGFISNELFNYLFLKRIKNIICKYKILETNDAYLDASVEKVLETLAAKIKIADEVDETDGVYRVSRSQVKKRMNGINIAVYGESAASQIVTSSEKKTSDHFIFLQDWINSSISIKELLRKYDELGEKTKDYISSIYSVVEFYYEKTLLLDKKNRYFNEQHIENIFAGIRNQNKSIGLYSVYPIKSWHLLILIKKSKR